MLVERMRAWKRLIAVLFAKACTINGQTFLHGAMGHPIYYVYQPVKSPSEIMKEASRAGDEAANPSY
jgi:hypothetical protein